MAEKTVKRYSKEALNSSLHLDRETYKRIKHMDKVELSNYIEAVYTKAFSKGYEAGKKAMKIAPKVK